MRWLLLLALLGAACADKPVEPPPRGEVVATLNASGNLRVGDAAGTLDDLGEALREAAEDEQPRVLRMRVDARTPWRSVQWLMLIAVEHGVRDLVLEVAGERAKIRLPKDGDEEHSSADYVAHLVVAGATAEEVRYRFAGRESTDPDVFAEWLDLAREIAEAAGGVLRVGEIRASPYAQAKTMLGTIARIRAAGIDDVEFSGTALPDDDERKATRLPAPRGAASVPRSPGVTPYGFEEDSPEEDTVVEPAPPR
jgi:hypothetical protein